jgi:hypothetical protein
MYSVNYTSSNPDNRGAYGIAYFEHDRESEAIAFVAKMNAQYPDRNYSYDYVSETF